MHRLAMLIEGETRVRAQGECGPLSLRANFSWSLVGNAVYAACQWAMLSVLAKLGTPEVVGQFSLGLAVTAPVMMLAHLQLREIQVTDARRQYGFGEYLALRLLTMGLALLAFVVLGIAGGYALELGLVIVAMGVQRTFHSLSDIYYGLMQQRQRLDRVAKSLLIKGVLGLAALSSAFAVTRSLCVAAFALAGVYGMVWLVWDRPGAALVATDAELHLRWNPRRLVRLTCLALPMGVMAMLVSLDSSIPRYMIGRLLGERELGFFTTMAYTRSVGALVVSSLAHSALATLSRSLDAGENLSFSWLIVRLAGLSGGLGVVLILLVSCWGPNILAFLYTEEYAGRNDVFILLTVAAAVGFVASILEFGLTAARRFRLRLAIALIVCLGIGATSMLLIPRYGLLGSAWAAIVANALNCMLCIGGLVSVARGSPAAPGEEA